MLKILFIEKFDGYGMERVSFMVANGARVRGGRKTNRC